MQVRGPDVLSWRPGPASLSTAQKTSLRMSLLPWLFLPSLFSRLKAAQASQGPDRVCSGARSIPGPGKRELSHTAVKSGLFGWFVRKETCLQLKRLGDSDYWPIPQLLPFLLAVNTCAHQCSNLVKEILSSLLQRVASC